MEEKDSQEDLDLEDEARGIIHNYKDMPIETVTNSRTKTLWWMNEYD